jgi:hypothetical protein
MAKKQKNVAKYQYNIGDRVEFYSPKHDRTLAGVIEQIDITITAIFNNTIVYTIQGDEVINSNCMHTVTENYISKSL